MLPPTGADAVVDWGAVGGRGPRLRDPADGAEAKGVAPSGEQASQDSAARGPAVVWVDNRQLVLGGPPQVEVIVV